LVNLNPIGRLVVKERAKEVGANIATIYRWVKLYRSEGVLSLLPKKRGWKTGRSRIDPLAEKIIHEVIQDFYLTPQCPTAQKAVLEVLRRCRENMIKPPNPGTIRQRLSHALKKERLRGRKSKGKTKGEVLGKKPAPARVELDNPQKPSATPVLLEYAEPFEDIK